ncbi:hypothetical protein [Nitrococcus mobilis]|uniref:hypothetical protein n=1 Tax=Nitrococcus mobilis TaxID=35797 RepID=UPI0012E9DA0E|nr:hypothetical protein [Nitrococcus mobilis]
MEEKEKIESRRVQLKVLQSRIALHGARMWQLPLTYWGAIAIALTAASKNGGKLPLTIVFSVMAVIGVILVWALRGAEKGYTRAAINMNETEGYLEIPRYTRIKSSYRYPYYILIVFGVISCVIAAWHFR